MGERKMAGKSPSPASDIPEYQNFLTSPRALEACKQAGIVEDELLPRSIQDFKRPGVTVKQAHIQLVAHENERRRLLEVVTQGRIGIIKEAERDERTSVASFSSCSSFVTAVSMAQEKQEKMLERRQVATMRQIQRDVHHLLVENENAADDRLFRTQIQSELSRKAEKERRRKEQLELARVQKHELQQELKASQQQQEAVALQRTKDTIARERELEIQMLEQKKKVRQLQLHRKRQSEAERKAKSAHDVQEMQAQLKEALCAQVAERNKRVEHFVQERKDEWKAQSDAKQAQRNLVSNDQREQVEQRREELVQHQLQDIRRLQKAKQIRAREEEQQRV